MRATYTHNYVNRRQPASTNYDQQINKDNETFATTVTVTVLPTILYFGSSWSWSLSSCCPPRAVLIIFLVVILFVVLLVSYLQAIMLILSFSLHTYVGSMFSIVYEVANVPVCQDF